jgi:ATP-dependent Clp protease adapter protein ClpS
MGKSLVEKAPHKVHAPADTSSSGHGWMTVLFNDEWHTFPEVAHQLVKAVGCTYERGLALANVVHHTGSAIVFKGPKERCEAAAGGLESIKLKTQVCQ